MFNSTGQNFPRTSSPLSFFLLFWGPPLPSTNQATQYIYIYIFNKKTHILCWGPLLPAQKLGRARCLSTATAESGAGQGGRHPGIFCLHVLREKRTVPEPKGNCCVLRIFIAWASDAGSIQPFHFKFLCVRLCLVVCLVVCLFVRLSGAGWLAGWLAGCQSVSLFVCLSVCLIVCPSRDLRSSSELASNDELTNQGRFLGIRDFQLTYRNLRRLYVCADVSIF